MRVLAITNLFPHAERPLLGPYNLYQFRALRELCELDILATVPWFPGANLLSRWTRGGRTSSIPHSEEYGGLWVERPRTLYLPRMLALSGPLFAASLLPRVLLRYRGKVDVVYACWGYPDGCAAVALAEVLGVPAVVKTLGSDVNVLSRRSDVEPFMRAMLPRAARVVAVSRPLRQRLCELGVASERVEVISDAVDRERFRPRDRAEARAALGVPADRNLILYVGNVLETKGILDLAAAFELVASRQPDTDLVVVGDGSARAVAEDFARRIGPHDQPPDKWRMRVVGSQSQEEVALWMAACDVLTLPSWAEGTPVVILEAFSSGRRVVASDVGGIPDLIRTETLGDLLGELVPARDTAALTDALCRAAEAKYDPAEIVARGAPPNWTENAAQIHQLFETVVAERRSARG
ncbi:MAG: glycosyltransferase family 4 protein [Myxococcota bacterium]